MVLSSGSLESGTGSSNSLRSTIQSTGFCTFQRIARNPARVRQLRSYMRLVFRWGGFPGYEGVDVGIPAEIATLRDALALF
jgi:hypothetical protein